MTERRDDTTKPRDESRPARRPGAYYYDDATGYEPYDPDEDDEEAGESGEGGGLGRAGGAASASPSSG